MVPGLNLQCHLTPAGTLLHQAVFGLRQTSPISFFTAPTTGRMGMGNGVSTERGGLPQLCPPPPPHPTLDSAFAKQATQPRVPAVAARAQPGTTTRTKQAVLPLCSSCSPCRCHRSPQHLELRHLLSMLVACRTTLLITGTVYVPCYSDIFFFRSKRPKGSLISEQRMLIPLDDILRWSWMSSEVARPALASPAVAWFRP